MELKHKHKILPWIGLAALLAGAAIWIAFIWHNSSQVVEDSAQRSQALLEYAKPFLEQLGIPDTRQHFVLRKMAHMLEFFIMGILVTCFLTSLSFFRKRPWWRDFLAQTVCALVAAADEYIQLDIPGRSGSVEDFAIDFWSALAGVALCHLLLFIIHLVRKIIAHFPHKE